MQENGTPFGRFRLLDQLGRGGMGEVWRAFDTATERVVAIKVLPAQFADDEVFQERFRREARSAAALNEPHVVPVYEFGEIDGRLFVAMRLIEGCDLNSVLKDGPMEAARAVAIIEQIASALHAAHQVNLVHRDVKPSNILLGEDDFAYLIDFGIARVAGEEGLTSTSTVIGTWAYIAPERITTGRADARADIYALACVFYECLTGSKPFGGDSLEQQIGGHLALPPPRASAENTSVPSELDAVIARGMAKDPASRYATTRDLALAARNALTVPHPLPPTIAAPHFSDRGRQPDHLGATVFAGTPPNAPPAEQGLRPPAADPRATPSRPSRKGRIIAFSGVGAVAVIAAVVAAIAFSSPDPPPVPRKSPVVATPNSGPFTGSFVAALGPKMKSSGAPATDEADSAGFSENWQLRSVCTGRGCVATASNDSRYSAKSVVFDDIDGRWVAVSTVRWKCKDRDDDEAWQVLSMQPQPDGSMAGEWSFATPNGCFSKRTVKFSRNGDADVSKLPDPATLPARLKSPATALHGSYDVQTTYSNGYKTAVLHYGVRTDCVRSGDKCMSFFIREGGGSQPFVFANGAWTRHQTYDSKCSSGGSNPTTTTTSLPLPQPPQDPIQSLQGHGYDEVASAPGSKCRSQAFDETFTRTGD